MREYTDQEYRNVLGNDRMESSLVDEKLAQVYGKIRKEEKRRKGKRMKKVFAGVSILAASFALMIVFCAANPVMAAKLPIIGSFFKDVEEKVSYKGDYSSRSEKLILEGTEEGVEEVTEKDSPYIQTDNGVTITVGEVYCNDMALYLGVRVHKDQPISKEFMERHTSWDGTHYISMVAPIIMDRQEETDGIIIACPYGMEGSFVDDHTFTGIIRVGIDEFTEELHPEYEGEISEENWDEYFRKVNMPDEFTCRIEIEEIFSEYTFFDGEEKNDEVEGSWNFTVDVKKDSSQDVVKEINERDENGFGVAKITKTPYEIQAEPLLPEGEERVDYIVAICDAQGKPLEVRGSLAEVYGTYQRDVSKVIVYICDYDTYMDECKAENWPNLSKKALYSTEISFEE